MTTVGEEITRRATVPGRKGVVGAGGATSARDTSRRPDFSDVAVTG